MTQQLLNELPQIVQPCLCASHAGFSVSQQPLAGPAAAPSNITAHQAFDPKRWIVFYSLFLDNWIKIYKDKDILKV